MFGHPIAKDIERWWKNHGGRATDSQWRLYIDAYLSLIRRKADELLEPHSNFGRFGMSKAGGCTRAAQLAYLGAKKEAFSGSSLVTFHIGHNVEVIALATLIAAGYDISEIQEPLSIDPMMASARDATIVLNGVRTLLSVKSNGYKKSGSEWRGREKVWVRRGFPELPFEGVRRSQPSHFAQIQAEMQADGYEQGLMLYVAKDMVKAMEGDPYLGENGNGSLTFYAELVIRDQKLIDEALVPAWVEAWGHVRRGEAGRGLYLHKSENRYVEINPIDAKANKEAAGMKWDPCDYCDFRAACVASKPDILEAQLKASIEAAEAANAVA